MVHIKIGNIKNLAWAVDVKGTLEIGIIVQVLEILMEADRIGILFRFLELDGEEGFTILELRDPLGGKVEEL